jgi:hypothetical protein
MEERREKRLAIHVFSKASRQNLDCWVCAGKESQKKAIADRPKIKKKKM